MVTRPSCLPGPRSVSVAIAVIAEDELLRDVIALVLARAGFLVCDEADLILHARVDCVEISRGAVRCAELPRPIWESELLAAVSSVVA